MKTLYRIYEFLFDRWRWEVESYENVSYRNHEYNLIYKKERIIIYKLTNKFDGSVKYKSKTIEI